MRRFKSARRLCFPQRLRAARLSGPLHFGADFGAVPLAWAKFPSAYGSYGGGQPLSPAAPASLPAVQSGLSVTGSWSFTTVPSSRISNRADLCTRAWPPVVRSRRPSTVIWTTNDPSTRPSLAYHADVVEYRREGALRVHGRVEYLLDLEVVVRAWPDHVVVVHESLSLSRSQRHDVLRAASEAVDIAGALADAGDAIWVTLDFGDRHAKAREYLEGEEVKRTREVNELAGPAGGAGREHRLGEWDLLVADDLARGKHRLGRRGRSRGTGRITGGEQQRACGHKACGAGHGDPPGLSV